MNIKNIQMKWYVLTSVAVLLLTGLIFFSLGNAHPLNSQATELKNTINMQLVTTLSEDSYLCTQIQEQPAHQTNADHNSNLLYKNIIVYIP